MVQWMYCRNCGAIVDEFESVCSQCNEQNMLNKELPSNDDEDGFERDLREAEEDLKNRDEEDFDEWGNPIQYG